MTAIASLFRNINPWQGVLDPHVAPTQGVTQLTEDVAVPAGRAVLFDVTGAGTVVYTLVNGDIITLNLQADQIYEFNDAVTMVASSGTATLVAWVKY